MNDDTPLETGEGDALPYSPPPPEKVTATLGLLNALEKHVDEYLGDYELRAHEGSYTPTDTERVLIADAIHGLLADDEFIALFEAWRADANAFRALLVPPPGLTFGKVGKKMSFSIGTQSFVLDFEPEEPGEFEFMEQCLRRALGSMASQPALAERPQIDYRKLLTPDVLEAEDAAGGVFAAGALVSPPPQAEAPSEPVEAAWRDLALQFDGQRMQALGWLKLVARELPQTPAWVGLRHFLASPPLSGEAVLAERIEALAAQQAVLTEPAWHPIATAPRDGTNVLLRWGVDGVSQAKFVPGLSHPWKFIDTNDGITWLINHCVDGPGGPSHWMHMPDTFTAAPPAPGQAKRDTLTPEDADLLEQAINDFEDSGETAVDYSDLMRFARMGHLECRHFDVMPSAREAIGSARSSEGGTPC